MRFLTPELRLLQFWHLLEFTFSNISQLPQPLILSYTKKYGYCKNAQCIRNQYVRVTERRGQKPCHAFMSKTILHVHTDNSVKMCAVSPEDVVTKAKACGYTSVALADNGNMTGMLRFYNAALKNGINPIIGVECNVSMSENVEKLSYITLYAKDKSGYQALCKIISKENKVINKEGRPSVSYTDFCKFFKNWPSGHVIAMLGGTGSLPEYVLGLSKKERDEIAAREAALGQRPGKGIEEKKKRLEMLDEEIKVEEQEKKRLEKTAKRVFIKRIEKVERLRQENSENYADEKAALDADMTESEQAKALFEKSKSKIASWKRMRAKTKKDIAEEEEKALSWDKTKADLDALKAKSIGRNDVYSTLKDIYEKLKDIFGKNLYTEIVFHGKDGEKEIVETMINVSNELGVPFVLSNEPMTIDENEKDDYRRHLILSLQKNAWVPEEVGGDKCGILLPEEIRQRAESVLGAKAAALAENNTNRIGEECTFRFEEKPNHYPKYNLPEGETAPHLMEKLAREAIPKRFPNGGWDEEHEKRLRYELGVIEKTGYCDYTLNVKGILDMAEKKAERDGFTGCTVGPGRGCQIKGGLVLTTEGFRKIEDVTTNDYVYDMEGKPAPVLGTFRYDVDETLLDITCYGSGTVTFTRDHRFLTVPGNEEGTPFSVSPEWKAASKLKPGDWLLMPKIKLFPGASDCAVYDLAAYPRPVSTIDRRTGAKLYPHYQSSANRYVEMSNELAYLLGAFLADGTMDRGMARFFGSGPAVFDITSKLNQAFGEIKVSVTKKSGRYTTVVHDDAASDLLCSLTYDGISGKRKVPEDVLGPRPVMASFIRGLFNTCGKSYGSETKAAAESLDVALGIKRVLLALGIPSEISTQVPGTSELGYFVTVGYSLQSASIITGFSQACREGEKAIRSDKKYTYMKIRDIVRHRYKGSVYDLKVGTDTEPSYCTDVCVVHNSGAGSLCNYLLGITNVDPLPYGLIFERYLNIERISPPDIDSDIATSIRDWLVGSIKEKYAGKKDCIGVCSIVTHTTLAARAAIRAAGRIISMKDKGSSVAYNNIYDAMAKMVPQKPHITIADTESEIAERFGDNRKAMEILEAAKLLEGVTVGYGTHAAGVIISDNGDVTDYAPLVNVGTTDAPMWNIQCDMVESEGLGLLKMDMLGLTTLDIIDRTVELAYKRYGVRINIHAIPFEKEVFENIYSTGNTDCVFQCESAGMKKMWKALRPDSIDDILAGIALFRPGPMDFIPDYIEGKKHPDDIHYKTPMLRPILEKTYGCIVYQEQVMQIVRDLAGFSMGRSDLVRRGMAKKKARILNEERKNFVYGNKEAFDAGEDSVYIPGCVSKGISADVANSIYDDMISFASYAFNKSHAAAYALVSYQTAWLKYHYPAEFMASSLNFAKTEKYPGIISACRDMGITVKTPDINRSWEGFTVLDSHTIIYGLSNVKGVGSAAEKIISCRSPLFAGPVDFLTRCDINKGAAVALAKAGAFDAFCNDREKLVSNIPAVADIVKRLKKLNAAAKDAEEKFCVTADDKAKAALETKVRSAKQRARAAKDKLAEIQLADGKQDVSINLMYEKDVLYSYISAHPFDPYEECAPPGHDKICDASGYLDVSGKGLQAVFYGIISDVKKSKSKKSGKDYASFSLEDKTGRLKCLCFPDRYEALEGDIMENEAVKIEGKIRRDRDDPDVPECFVEKVEPLESGLPQVLLYLYNSCINWKSAIVHCATSQGHRLFVYDRTTGRLEDTGIFVNEKVFECPLGEYMAYTRANLRTKKKKELGLKDIVFECGEDPKEDKGREEGGPQ